MANQPTGRSFLQAIQTTEEVAPPLRVVQMEGLAVVKIIKHCKEFTPALVTGQLLGLDVGSVLEVTNCFPFPTREEDEELEADGANYQLEMMRCLREVNVDNNTVGWYQSTLLGSFQTAELIETFMNYQENIRRCVCIIYDPSRSNQGVLALKALRLSDSFMELYRNNNFNGEKLREKKLSWVNAFEEIPIKVSNSALISAFMTELEPESPVSQCDFWEWKDEDYCLTSNPASDFANLLWDGYNQDENDLLHLLGDQTPMKECMDFKDIPFCYEDYINKDLQEEISEPPSMVKRRKMLQFTSDSNEDDAEKIQITSSTVTSVWTQSSTSSNGISESLHISTNSNSNNPESASALPRGGLSHSSEWWSGNSTPEKLSYYSSDETSCSKNYAASAFDKINISGLGDGVADGESEVVEHTTKLSTLKIFKGKKTVIKAPKKVPSTVAYPFTMIKPYGVQDGVSLDDINAKIHAPPVVKKKQQHVGKFAYPISQFSGKPVVGKKKICTEGGKGSITILRTKG